MSGVPPRYPSPQPQPQIPHPLVGSGRQIPLTCAGHTRPVVQLQFSGILDDGNYLLVSACKDGSPMLRIGDTGDWIGTFAGHKGAVWCARLSADASRAVTASADFTAKVWDTYSGGVLHTFNHRHIVRAADISPDGRWIVTGGNEKIIRIFDVENAKLVRECKAHNQTIKTVLWDEQRRVIISAADEKSVKVWSIDSLELLHMMETLDPVASLCLSDDGEVIQAAAGKSVYFWSAQTYELACRIDTKYDLSCVVLHPGRDRFVCGSRDELWVRTFAFPTGEELEMYKGHHGPVHTVAYSPDGELYASGSEDGTIRLWQTIPGTEYGLWRTQEPDPAEEQAALMAAEAEYLAQLQQQQQQQQQQSQYMQPPFMPLGHNPHQLLTGVLSPEEEELLQLQAQEDYRKQQALLQQQQARQQQSYSGRSLASLVEESSQTGSMSGPINAAYAAVASGSTKYVTAQGGASASSNGAFTAYDAAPRSNNSDRDNSYRKP